MELLLERDELLTTDDDNLARAYLCDFERVAPFYGADYRKISDLAARAESIAGQSWFTPSSRAHLADTLATYAQGLGADQSSLDAIKLLRRSDGVAVVTGQQPGIAGGPLMLLHKVAHAIALANELQQQGVNAVPVFWCASEDHDIDEVNRFVVSSTKGRTKPLRIRRFGSGTTTCLDALEYDSADGDVAAIRARIDDQKLAEVATSGGIGEALNRTLLRVFAGQGLVVLEPKILRGLEAYASVVGHELAHAIEIQRLIADQEFRVENAGFRTALDAPTYANVFLLNGNRQRQHIQCNLADFTVDGLEQPLSKREMLELCAAVPERFSTGVRLRPIAQGACLPTVAYIGGPAETAYHASLKSLFQFFGVLMPAIVPRWSFLLAEDANEAGRLREVWLGARRAARLARAGVSETRNETRAVLANLNRQLGALAKPLEAEIERVQGRIDKSLNEMAGRIGAAPLDNTHVNPDDALALQWLYPSLNPQERELSWLGVWSHWKDTLLRAYSKRSALDFSLGVISPPQS